MSRGIVVNREDVAFNRAQRIVENNPIQIDRKISIMEQERLAKESIRRENILKLKRLNEKENEERVLLDSPYSSGAFRNNMKQKFNL